MTNTPYSHHPHDDTESRRIPWRKKFGYLFDASLIVCAILLLAYTGTQAYKLHKGVSLEEPRPMFQVRLQISNASGQSGLEKPLARQWGGYSDKLVAIEVVEQLGMAELAVPETFLVIRGDDPKLGKALTAAFGLPEQNVVFKPIEADTHQVTATLVVGKDWSTALKKRQTKEI